VAIIFANSIISLSPEFLASDSNFDIAVISFSVNLYDYIPENRYSLLVNGLIILKAYYNAGLPKDGNEFAEFKEYGRFEEWSSLVRGALIWLGMVDPCASRKEIENADPVRATLGNLLATWYAVFSSAEKKVKDVIREINLDANKNIEVFNNLKDALVDMAPDGKGGINESMLSRKIPNFKDRIENGYRFEKAGESGGVVRWCVKKVSSGQKTLGASGA
jgi:putative DNA primase/helicase